MMKTTKFLSAAMGLIALASCNSYDYDIADTKTDLSNKYILKANVEEESVTRAYWDATNSSTNFTWGEGDILRVYDSNLRVYDNFEYDRSGNFLTDATQANIKNTNEDGMLDYKYAIFAEPECVSYAGWNNGHNIALIKIKDKFDYSESVSSTDGETVVYKFAVPMWGAVTPVVSEVQTDAKSFDTNLKWLTTRARVTFNNGLDAGIKTVRATSVKVAASATNDQKTAIETIASTGHTTQITNLTSEVMSEVESALENNTGAPLSGWFEAMLELDESGEALAHPLRKPTMGGVDPEYSATVEVDMEDKITANSAYTSIVYLPITILDLSADEENAYEYLLFEYQTTDNKWHFLRLYDYADALSKGFGRTNTLNMATVTTKRTSTATTLYQVNEFLKSLTEDGDITVDFTEKVASFTINGGSSLLGSYSDDELEIPAAWSNRTVTLNFTGGANANETGLITSGTSGETIEWSVTNKQAPHGVTKEQITPAPVKIKNNGNNVKVVINVANAGRKVVANVTENSGTVVLGQNVSEISASAGKIVVDASETTAEVTVETTAETATSVEVIGGTVATLTHNGTGEVVVDHATVTTLTNYGGDITVQNDGYVKTLSNQGEGDVEVTGAKFYTLSNGANGGNITISNITGNAQSINSTSTGTVTIKNDVEGKKRVQIHTVAVKASSVEIENVDVDVTLRFSATPTSVSITNCNVGTLTYNAPGNAELKSYGNSMIGSVTENGTAYSEFFKENAASEPKLTFYSEWDGESKATKAANSGTYEVYTAAELAALQASVSHTAVNLYADIDLKDKLWTGIYFTTDVTLNGNGKKIENVSVGNSAETKDHRSQTQYGYGFINEAKGTLTVSDLTLEKVKTTELKLTNEVTQISGIGGLVGRLNNTGNFKKVKVTGSYLGLSSSQEIRDFDGSNTTSCKVGGLLGMMMAGGSTSDQGAVTIEECTVDIDEIAGQWALGGLIGDGRTQNGLITLTNNNVKVGKFKPTLHIEGKTNDTEISDFYGRIGMLIGCIVDYEWKDAQPSLTISQGANYKIEDCIVGKRVELGFAKNIRTVNNELEMFQGYTYNNILYVGYSGVEGVVSNGTFSLTINGNKVSDAPTTIAGLNIFKQYDKTGSEYSRRR